MVTSFLSSTNTATHLWAFSARLCYDHHFNDFKFPEHFCWFYHEFALFQALDASNLPDLASTTFLLTEILMIVLLICELGERVADEFDAYHSKLCQCDWYLLPFKMQRMYLIFVGHTQQTPKIQGYANVECTRDTFKKVIDSFLPNLVL